MIFRSVNTFNIENNKAEQLKYEENLKNRYIKHKMKCGIASEVNLNVDLPLRQFQKLSLL
jgi:hypothetical protein